MLEPAEQTTLRHTPEDLLTPCSRVLLEKLTGLQLVKKFPAFYGTEDCNLKTHGLLQEIRYHKVKPT
jgi:hypothetical protein